jgi:hypothetical protein
MAKAKKDGDKNDKNALEEETTFLERMANAQLPVSSPTPKAASSKNHVHSDNQNPNIPQIDNIFGEISPEELEAKIEEHKTDFEKKEAQCKNEARKILLNVAKLYVENKLIEDNEYIKFKLQIEEKSLSSMIFQLDITRQAVFKLSQKIHLDEASPRHFEVLSGMQRVILDITKYQHEHLSKLEMSMKALRDDLVLGGHMREGSGDNTEDRDEGEEVTGTIIETRDRKMLLKEINNMLLDGKFIKTPESRNVRLHDDDPDVLKSNHEPHPDENFGDDEDGDGGDGGDGFDTWVQDEE